MYLQAEEYERYKPILTEILKLNTKKVIEHEGRHYFRLKDLKEWRGQIWGEDHAEAILTKVNEAEKKLRGLEKIQEEDTLLQKLKDTGLDAKIDRELKDTPESLKFYKGLKKEKESQKPKEAILTSYQSRSSKLQAETEQPPPSPPKSRPSPGG